MLPSTMTDYGTAPRSAERRVCPGRDAYPANDNPTQKVYQDVLAGLVFRALCNTLREKETIMFHATISRLVGRGPSTRPTRARMTPVRAGPSRTRVCPPLPPEVTPAVARARRRLAEGFYDNDALLSCALDRLLDHAAARFGGRRTG